MNNPFDYIPDAECDGAYQRLLLRLDSLKGSDKREDVDFIRNLEEGSMLGVLIAEDANGLRYTFFAFSGQVGRAGFYYPGFVGPVFDYLQPDGYFKTKEREISQLNTEIALYEKGELAEIREEHDSVKKGLEADVEEYREICRLSKLKRDAKRESGLADEREEEEMIRQSQFEKAELHRLKKRVAAELQPFADKLKIATLHLDSLKEKRRLESEALQKWLFNNFTLLNGKGESKSLSDIFEETPIKTPPSGAGECCAPKLLQAAYLQDLVPVSMAEYWYGKSKEGTVRIHGNHYPSCRGRCLPILRWMLQGLPVDSPLDKDYGGSVTQNPEILYENRWFCVIDKPPGMLSVPGKGEGRSVQLWLEEKYGEEKGVKVAHRLDQDTSGLIIATFGELTFKLMQRLFSTRKVRKTYIADVEGDFRDLSVTPKGRIELPLSPDYLDRPRQRIDLKDGKEAITDYEFIGYDKGKSRIIFHPLTGRTHQLRVHSAAAEGLGMPIVGDRLYGKRGRDESGRLHLHAQKVEFVFPIDKKRYSFESPVKF